MNLNRAVPPIKLKRARQSWDAFDRLPREVRDALNYAAFKYAVTNCTAHNAAKLARDIKAMDARQVAESYSQREAQDELKELGL